jgi:DNA polymerase III sliding clamp (beta) subunit (PCNA family)
LCHCLILHFNNKLDTLFILLQFLIYMFSLIQSNLYIKATQGNLYLKATQGNLYLMATQGNLYLKATQGNLYLKATQGYLKMWSLAVAFYIQAKIICTIH